MAYLSLSTANLPDPVIDPAAGKEPADYFNTVLTTSTGSTLSVDVGFAADFLWTKARNFARSHELHDRVRGDNKRLKSDATTAEESYSDYVVFDDDGADLGTNHNLGYHAGGTTTGVVWAWKANGTGVSNTDGSITSTVSANTTSGFSVVKYTGTNDATESVGHGLDKKPEVILLKKLTAATDWAVYHESVCTDDRHFLYLNTTAALTTGGATRWDISAFNTSTFTVGDDHSVNAASTDYIAYCFHSVEGFSKCSSYVGNGSSDGVFVYTGFRPSFLMVKATNVAQSWVMLDNERAGYNVENYRLFAESSNAESTTTPIVDLLSNGFKWRNNFGNFNGSGNTYIYMAFAEMPTKFSLAR